MNQEELRLLKENNLMLKYIIKLFSEKDNSAKDFLINLTANLISEHIIRK